PADVIDVEYDCPAEPGASRLAEMMRLSTLYLENQYVATGCATAADIARYAEFAESRDGWGIYYATVRVLARRMGGEQVGRGARVAGGAGGAVSSSQVVTGASVASQK